MTMSVRQAQMVVLLTLLAILVALALPAASLALPAYASATGQACTACHVNATGVGGLNATGQRFAAVPTHQSNPAAAWQQVSQPAQATPAPTAAATAAATPRPATPAATAAPATGGKDATPAPTALPRTGDPNIAFLAVGAAMLAAAGLGLRRRGR